jgi:hypothetical protein
LADARNFKMKRKTQAAMPAWVTLHVNLQLTNVQGLGNSPLRLKAEAASQRYDSAAKTTGNGAEVGIADIIRDLVGVKVQIVE